MASRCQPDSGEAGSGAVVVVIRKNHIVSRSVAPMLHLVTIEGFPEVLVRRLPKVTSPSTTVVLVFLYGLTVAELVQRRVATPSSAPDWRRLVKPARTALAKLTHRLSTFRYKSIAQVPRSRSGRCDASLSQVSVQSSSACRYQITATVGKNSECLAVLPRTTAQALPRFHTRRLAPVHSRIRIRSHSPDSRSQPETTATRVTPAPQSGV